MKHATQAILIREVRTCKPCCVFKHVSLAQNTQVSLRKALHTNKNNIHILHTINFNNVIKMELVFFFSFMYKPSSMQ